MIISAVFIFYLYIHSQIVLLCKWKQSNWLHWVTLKSPTSEKYIFPQINFFATIFFSLICSHLHSPTVYTWIDLHITGKVNSTITPLEHLVVTDVFLNRNTGGKDLKSKYWLNQIWSILPLKFFIALEFQGLRPQTPPVCSLCPLDPSCIDNSLNRVIWLLWAMTLSMVPKKGYRKKLKLDSNTRYTPEKSF